MHKTNKDGSCINHIPLVTPDEFRKELNQKLDGEINTYTEPNKNHWIVYHEGTVEGEIKYVDGKYIP